MKSRELLFISFSMVAATAVKGLNGIILPVMAIALHTVLVDFKGSLKKGLRFFSFPLLPALILSGLYFGLLDFKIGHEFTKEFFWVHHFGRGMQAMESHHGPLYYYLIVLMLGGGALIPILGHEILRTRFDYRKFGFPLSFALATLIFYSLASTKLPHYSWPIWPALLLQVLTLQDQKSSGSPFLTGKKWMILNLGIFSAGIALFGLVFNPDWLPQTEIQEDELFFITVAATLCICLSLWMNKIIRQLERVSLFAVLICIAIAVPATKIVSRVMVDPFFEIARVLKAQNPKPEDCIRYSGPHSANLSLALGKELGKSFTHNRCEPTETRFLIVPKSKKDECSAPEFETLIEQPQLILCKKNGPLHK